MPLKRKSVLDPGTRLLEEIVELLASHPDEVFSWGEIIEMLIDKGLIVVESATGRQLSGPSVSQILDDLKYQHKVVRYPHQGTSYYGVSR